MSTWFFRVYRLKPNGMLSVDSVNSGYLFDEIPESGQLDQGSAGVVVRWVVALLPGSRHQEVTRNWPFDARRRQASCGTSSGHSIPGGELQRKPASALPLRLSARSGETLPLFFFCGGKTPEIIALCRCAMTRLGP